jgi:pimeloyl-ACP methyl ester carboxylesterase
MIAVAGATPGAAFVVLPNTGHIPSVDNPVEFARLVTEFAAGVGSR